MQAAGYDASPDIVPRPEAEVTADFQVVRDVVAHDPELSFARASASSSALGVTRAWNLYRCMPATTFGA